MGKKTKNVEGLCDALLENFDKLVADEIPMDKSKEILSNSRQILGHTRTKLSYDRRMGNKNEIKFLETSK